MYVYKIFLEVGVLMMKFSGSYISDEADQGILDIARSMKLDEKFAITRVILDLKDVTSMTLANTDRARVSHWEDELFATFNHPGKDAGAHLAAIEIANILTENSVVRDIYLTRLAKIRSDTRVVATGGNDFNNVVDLLEYLDLLDILPLLAEGWREAVTYGGIEGHP